MVAVESLDYSVKVSVLQFKSQATLDFNNENINESIGHYLVATLEKETLDTINFTSAETNITSAETLFEAQQTCIDNKNMYY